MSTFSSPGSAVAEWDNDYARVARVSSQMRTQGLNNNNNTSGYSTPGDDKQQLDAHLSRLESALGTLPLSVSELQRRRRLIQHLRGGSGSASTPTNSGGLNTAPYTPPPVASHMKQHMAEQDAMIDDLAAGMSRMKDQTQVIHDEARLHVKMLGEMDDNLGAAQSGLDAETKRAAKLREDKSVWRLQIIIAGEAVLCLLLLLAGLS
mmetsp:Transcript_10177/g.24488  ORF Transcript_10177/g.24488 Transcript_10177/m.24488 type:complete len:206 (+) Transcript_10177:88-705(+)